MELKDPAADQSKERGPVVVVERGVAAEENVEKNSESPDIASRSIAAGRDWRGGGGAKEVAPDFARLTCDERRLLATDNPMSP